MSRHVVTMLSASVAALLAGGALAADIPGNATTQATLKLGLKHQKGLIDRPNDADWYRVQLVKGRHYAFQLESFSLNCAALVDLVLADAKGRVLEQATDVCSEDAGFELTIARSGVHFVRVSGSIRARYVFRAAVDAAPNTGTKAVLSVNKPANGTLLFGFDTDYFRIHLLTDKTYYLKLESTGPCNYSFARVVDKAGNVIQDYVFYDFEVGEFSVPATGDYFVDVTDLDGDHGCAYRVSVTDTPPS